MSGIFIVAAKRTPFGAFGGSLANVSATQLGVHATKAALASLGGDAEAAAQAIDECYFGNVIQTGSDAAYLARHVALKSGCKIDTPSLTINRLCGSGFETVIQAAKAIQLGEANVVIAGGTESMSQAPLVVDGQKVRFKAGVPLGKGLHLRDSLWDGLSDAHAGTPMGMTAENLAQQYDISRQACDEYAVASQQKWQQANEAGLFAHEMAPMDVPKNKKTTITVSTDEHPRPQTTLESVSKLKPVFVPDTGVVTAANASGICDGAGSIIVASEEAVKQNNWTPLARLASYSVTGCDPKIMGIGPVQAIQAALARAGDLDLDRDVDRVEINEAFAAQTLACIKALDLDIEKTNIHGGAISLGHPLGASGSRIVAHLTNEFKYAPESQKRFVGSACIGGGQGIAVVLERV